MIRVLLVEDDPFIGEIYVKKFQASGFDVVNVVTGKAVLKAVLESHFDIVLLDLVIPEMSGMEVLRELRTKPEYPKDLRIVVFSNLSSQEDRDQCVALGANGFISKTEFSPSEVIEEVNRFLRQFTEQGKNEERLGGALETGESAVVTESQSVATEVSTDAKKILLIEDQEDFVEMFAKRLQDEGYILNIARDGKAGYDEAVANHYDMIISDILMPGMNGHEMVVKLRETEEGKNIPIFLFSASVEADTLKTFLDSGLVQNVFEKTRITPSELTYAVNDFFANKGN
ncbi:MAG: response regulator [Candidatus Moranbacteria bacterium]|nr:response regulator [Candidatus Moranbacteria bacterium]